VGGFFAMKERDVDLCALAGTDFGSARCALDIATMPRRPLPPTVEELHALCVRLAPDSPDGCVVDAVVTSRRSDLCARTATPGACRNDMDEALAADEGRCIGAPADIVACEQEATARFAAGSRNPALCDGLPEPRRTSCAVEVWARAGRETADPYPCAQIAQLGDAESADACRRFQALAPAIRSGDPERCLATEDAAACMSWQLQDPRSIAEHVLARAAGDPSSTSGEPPWGHLSVTARPPLDEAPAWQAVATPPGFVAQRRPLAAASPGAPRFERESGRALGLVLDGLDGTQLHEPFAFGRGVASADVDGDGDVDLAFGARGGPAIFHAHKGRYVRVAIPEAARGLDVMGVRFADMDGDARPDLWVSAWGGIVGWIANDGGGIGDGPLHAIPATDRLLAMAVALGDVDEDGDLDAILGTWTSGAATGFDAEHSTDELWLADGPGWRRAVLDDVPGETLANLLTDTDGDGVLELYSANDGPGPDVAFRFEEGVAVPIRRGDPGALPRTSWFAMSLDSGDLDGDGRLDLVSADMSFPRASVPSVCDAVPEGDAGACRSLVATSRAVRDVDVAACEDDGCRVGAALQFALLHRRADLCAALPWPDVRDFCAARLALSAAPDRAPPSEAYVPQVERNLILARTQDGFVDRTADWGLGGTGWTWNLRLVDLDADGDLDLHAGNGYLLSGPFPGDAVADVAQRWDGTGFADATEAWGLGDVNHTTAFVFVDVDGDGDLDRVATSPVSGPTVHRNQGGAGHSLVVLADAGGRNRDGIGARVEIRVSGRAQVAEVRASGGFLSAEAPAARFGLGDATTVDSVRVRWPDGGEAVLGPVPGDSVLRVARGE
jgi:hypothetical protein